eukprot:TRINITY_DN11666_c0_g1_i1.p1 TRINITY_DN11666_c0_g1~~TRINITY_DN11666_c0_g1_i1.p1  ORF type:complete len:427 (+),score=88.13 TRINITY_DN11666_c0_g1_i1:789-2069(+)
MLVQNQVSLSRSSKLQLSGVTFFFVFWLVMWWVPFLLCLLQTTEGKDFWSWVPSEEWTEDQAAVDWYWCTSCTFDKEEGLTLANAATSGYLFSKKKVPVASWQTDLTLSLGDSQGVGFFATSAFPTRGTFLGISGKWEGLGLFVLTDQVKDQFLVQSVINSGGRYASYTEHATEKVSILGSCIVDKQDTLDLRVRYDNSELLVETKGENGNWRICIYTLAELRGHLFTGVSSPVTIGEQKPIVKQFVVKEPELPFPNIPMTAQGGSAADDAEIVSRQMWAKIMNKLVGFEEDLSKSSQYINELVLESGDRITSFERSFQPLAATIDQVLDLAVSKIVELDEEGKAMDELEEQMKALETAIGKTEKDLTVISSRLKQGQALFDSITVKETGWTSKVDWFFGLLVIQTLLMVVIVCWRKKSSQRRLRM